MKAGGKSADNAPEAPLPTLQVQLRQLSRTLKVPQALADTAYRNFVEVQANYVLTGSPLEWLACALYFVTPHDAVKGNHSNPAPSFMSLANFLMQFDMSFDTFMEKSEKWANMHSTNTERMIGVLRDHHRAYTVSKLIFRSFDDMFWMMFSHPNTSQDTSVDAKLQEAKNAVAKKKPPVVADSKKPPTAEEIFQFTWGLFCYVRRDEGKVKDSVLSNTLLIVCMEQMLQDIIACGHQHMLNEEFKSFPPALFEESGMVEIPELLETLCERFQGMVGEARAIKANWLQPRLAAMLEKETMRGDVASQTGLLRAENLAWNVHGIFAMYYESNEKVHGYDELQFLRLPRRFGECKIQFDVKLRPVDVRVPKKGKSEALATIKMEKASENSMHTTAQAGKGVLEALDTVFSNVSGLQKLLEGCSRAPSANLTQVFDDCDTTGEETSVQTRVDQHVRAGITKFREHHSEADDMTKVENQEDLAVILYYKLLEGIVMDEKRRMTSAGIALALAQDVLHHALLAACFEIVLFCTHDTSHRFPWILNTLSLAPYNFFRIIELLIRVEPDFSRDVTSHLSKVEEQILESMAWLESSPLWDKLYPDGQRGPVPSCAEAFLPGQLEAIGRNLSAVMKKVETSDLIHLSPVPSSTTFRDPQSKAAEEVENEEKEEGQAEEASKTPVVPRKATHSSVDIFFRKFYSLAFVRLNCFGELLDMKRNDLIQKTWTCFEHAIKTHTQIMRGRHMDQILMCCIYITCKATGYDVKFEEIMKCYRTQRNAASHIYRSVLIKNQGNDVPLSPVEIPPDNLQDRGDIIKFYNAVFLETMGGFAEQFCATPANQENLLLLLSPVPRLQSLTVSPRKRVSNKFRVYVSPLNPSLKPPSLSPNRIQFQLTLDQRFPPKNVQAINNYVGQTRAVSGVSSLIKSPMKQAQKRLLTDEPAPVLPGGEKFAKKLRQAQIALPPPSD